jgi:uncharacterized MAPEG superfamily protein
MGPLFAPMYLAVVPLATYITKPGGTVQKILESALKLFPGDPVANDRVIPALSAIYLFWVFAGTGAFSVAAQGMARKEGFDNNHPRAYVHTMQGLPLRMRSAHYNLIEGFAGFALAAALAQSISPQDQQNKNLLGLHVLVKVAVYYGAYLADVAPLRSLSHMLAVSSVIGVCWRLAGGA